MPRQLSHDTLNAGARYWDKKHVPSTQKLSLTGTARSGRATVLGVAGIKMDCPGMRR